MRRGVWAFAAGVLFAFGLGLSGMTQPQKVLAFLDFAGEWDPALAFVMAGAVGTYMAGWLVLRRRRTPWMAAAWAVPSRARSLTVPMAVGAGMFGVGWGLVGYCPGPAIVGVATLAPKALLFFVCMSGGLMAYHAYTAWRVRRGIARANAGGCGDVTGHLPNLDGHAAGR